MDSHNVIFGTFGTGGRIEVPEIKVSALGVGGMGMRMLMDLKNISYSPFDIVQIDTDAQDILSLPIGTKQRIQIGIDTTSGLSTGGDAEKGKRSVASPKERGCAYEIQKKIETSDLVFITAGMCRGTGTGATPEIAKIAKEPCRFTKTGERLIIAIVTEPLQSEGKLRNEIAQKGIGELLCYGIPTIVIPLEGFLQKGSQDIPWEQVSAIVADMARAIIESISSSGSFRLGFRGIKDFFSDTGEIEVSIGRGSEEKGVSFKTISREKSLSLPKKRLSIIKTAENPPLSRINEMLENLSEYLGRGKKEMDFFFAVNDSDKEFPEGEIEIVTFTS